MDFLYEGEAELLRSGSKVCKRKRQTMSVLPFRIHFDLRYKYPIAERPLQ